MKYTSIFEKFSCLFELITSSIIYPIFLAILIILISLLFTKKIKNRKVIVLMIISYLLLFITVIINNSKALSKVFDSISTNLFTNIYFPSTYTYLFVLILVDVVTIITILNVKVEKIYKIINGICFFIIQFIFALIMDTVAKGNIDIFSKKSLFTNSNLVILLESSINIFILWLIALFVVYVTNKVSERIAINQTDKILDKSPVTDIPNTLVIDNVQIPEDIEKPTESVISSVITNIVEETNTDAITNKEDSFSLKDLITENENTDTYNSTTKNIIEENVVDSNVLLEKLLNNELPLIYETTKEESEKPKETKDTYTLNDYRIFNKILKDIQENNNSSIINIDEKLELKLITKYTEKEYNLFKGMLKNYSN